jgi:hypothetical protein
MAKVGAMSSERATHFRAESARLRWLADVERDAQLREKLVVLAGEYREMAEQIDERADDPVW